MFFPPPKNKKFVAKNLGSSFRVSVDSFVCLCLATCVDVCRYVVCGRYLVSTVCLGMCVYFMLMVQPPPFVSRVPLPGLDTPASHAPPAASREENQNFLLGGDSLNTIQWPSDTRRK